MRASYYRKDREEFWDSHWKRIGRDVDRLSDTAVYPLFPVDKYVERDGMILEAGCGLGRVIKHYRHQGYAIQGMELNRYCCDVLRAENPRLPLTRASIVNLPYRDSSFDVAMAFGVIGHLGDGMTKAFGELYRVLSENGILAGSLCVDNCARRMMSLADAVRFAGRKRHFYTWLFTRDNIRRTLHEHGFELVELHPVTTREHFHRVPFLRSGASFSPTLARDAERGYRLNAAGEALYRLLRRTVPWEFAFTASFIARKV